MISNKCLWMQMPTSSIVKQNSPKLFSTMLKSMSKPKLPENVENCDQSTNFINFKHDRESDKCNEADHFFNALRYGDIFFYINVSM